MNLKKDHARLQRHERLIEHRLTIPELFGALKEDLESLDDDGDVSLALLHKVQVCSQALQNMVETLGTA